MKFVFTMFVLCWFSSQFTTSEAASCTYIAHRDFPKPECPVYVVIDNKRINRNDFDVRISLSGPLKRVRWFCGEHDGTFTWSRSANQVRASFIAGELKIEVYSCDDLSGPNKPDLTCALNKFGYACPGLITSNHSCVFEIRETKTTVHSTVDAVEVGGSVAAIVKGSLIGISASARRQRTEAEIVTYSKKSYIVIPSGYRFCSYSEAKTIKNRLAPTGYEWHCFLPKFLQGKINGQCGTESLLQCKTEIECTREKEEDDSGGAVVSSLNVLMLIAISAVIVICS